MRTIKDIPFIDISRENLMAANDFLDREQKGELLEMIIDTVLNGVEPTSDDRAVTGVYNQFMAVIGRKAEGVIKKLNALDEVNAEKKKGKEQSTSEPEQLTNLSLSQDDIKSIIEDEHQETYKKLEDWLNDIENGLDSGSYQTVFDNGWELFFKRRSDALSFVYSRIRRIGGRYTSLV